MSLSASLPLVSLLPLSCLNVKLETTTTPTPIQGEFPAKCNMGMVALESVESPEDVEALHGFIQAHQEHTGSTTAQKLLDDFGTEVTKFVKVRGLLLFAWCC